MAVQEGAFVGTWKSDPSDAAGTGAYGNVTLKFGSDGTLLYIIHESDRDQVMRLTYRTEPGVIVTDQPSQPQPERTEYEFAEDGALVLAFSGRKSRYVKVR
jgi:hypothetical protein